MKITLFVNLIQNCDVMAQFEKRIQNHKNNQFEKKSFFIEQLEIVCFHLEVIFFSYVH